MHDLHNCLSVDVEGFVEANRQSFHIDLEYVDKSKETYEIEQNMECLLELLAGAGVHATFFFLGRIARDIPQIIKRVAESGHEIACHSYDHLRILGMSNHGFQEAIRSAKDSLESVSGQRVYGFRAPDFSITNGSLWALDILREAGIVYDSSIYPIRVHDVYGVRDAKRFIHLMQNGLIEWPLCTFEGPGGVRIPFGGGGYFRLYPLMFTKYAISSMNVCGHPCMFYIHPYEIGPIIPRITSLSCYRRFRHYHNCRTGRERLSTLLKTFRFGRAIDILSQGKLPGGPRACLA